jgi:tetrahedral aminopeptidase
MDPLLKKIILAAGVSGYESEIAAIMKQELKKTSDAITGDSFGNIIARKGKGGKKIMVAAHMDEIGLMVKHVSKEGFISFIKIGGIDDRVLPGQRVIVKSKKGDLCGIIGTKPPHLLKEEERKQPIKYDNMFIDVGLPGRDEVLKKIEISDPVIFEPNAGVLNGKLCYGKAPDDRVGCYVLLKIMERLKAKAEVYAVATTQEEVGLKGARVASFGIAPDFALVVDTTVAGDTPGVSEKEADLKLGKGVAITIIEAAGRGLLVNGAVKEMFFDTARKHKIAYQIDVVEGGMTDGAIIAMNREGILTGTIAVPCRYIHAPTGVFHLDDVESAIALGTRIVERVAGEK